LENLSDSGDINRSWDIIKENIKTSATVGLGLYELEHHKAWFDVECSLYLDQKRQAKMQWLQDPNQRTTENIKNVRRNNSRHFRNKRRNVCKLQVD